MNIRILSALSLAAALSTAAASHAAVVDARPILQTAPCYSHELRSEGAEGQVVVKFTISEKGDVVNPVVASTTNRVLDAATVKAVRNWKFAPAMKDGVPVSVSAVQTVAYTIPELHDDAATRVTVMNRSSAKE
ncbi:MAG TPA: energy transducer TonB [Opitutaceae bacterium]|nr:energy transducer TonB [Opitutaceae bacterium]